MSIGVFSPATVYDVEADTKVLDLLVLALDPALAEHPAS